MSEGAGIASNDDASADPTGTRALVTGATGFLGAALCRRLREAGYEVTAMRRESSDVSALSGLDVSFAVGDVLDRGAVREAVAGHDHVYHLAGVGLMDADEETVWRVNVEGTRNVLDACRGAGVERVVFTSTAGTRGREDGPATEADVVDPVGAYQGSKRQAEKLVDDFAAADGTGDAVTVHPTSVFGPGDEKFTAKLLTLTTTPVPVYLPGGVSVVHVDDVARGIVAAMERGANGEHYLLGGENLTFGEALAVLADAGGGSKPPVRLPPFVIHAAGPVVGAINGVLGTKMFPVNAEMARLSTRELFYSSAKAERDLGYEWRPLRDHAAEAVAWFREGRADDGADDRERATDATHTA